MASGYEKSPDYGGPDPTWRFWLFAVAVAAVTVWSIVGAFAAGISASAITVTDGDTVRVNGRSTRLVGYNAPEITGARCQEELALGNRATARLRELVIAGNLTFQRVACSCRPGTEGTSACNHGRACGRLYSNGRDVGRILISEGLAVPFVCGPTRCPPAPRPWC